MMTTPIVDVPPVPGEDVDEETDATTTAIDAELAAQTLGEYQPSLVGTGPRR